MESFNIFTCHSGEQLYYCGKPDFGQLNALAQGPGDLWHSGVSQGSGELFPEIVYQTAVFFFFTDEFKGLNTSVSWRINPFQFVVRKQVWDQIGGFSKDYKSELMAAFEFGFKYLRYGGMVPLNVNGLFPKETHKYTISKKDRYQFFRRNFKKDHSLYMYLRRDFLSPVAINELRKTIVGNYYKLNQKYIDPKPLRPIQGNPQVSYIIPTMFRQEYTLQLLEDLSAQTYLPAEVVVIDATPEESRDERAYSSKDYPFELIFRWQVSQGSCKARNEAIDLCHGDYIVFGDDDIRIPANFIENHIRFLQSNGVQACNGLDIRADHYTDGLNELSRKLNDLNPLLRRAGVALSFSNANSCVSRDLVLKLRGNDDNFDGGYGEDSDFGFRLFKQGAIALNNPYSVNLHLKPPSGGYRFWGIQAKLLGKSRKSVPWERGIPVGLIKPIPSPTIMYGLLKNNTAVQRKEYTLKYFLRYLTSGPKFLLPFRLIGLPLRILSYKKSEFYAKNLIKSLTNQGA
jgi:glycosyltransferase involved in cell wall biosynthesis